MALVPGVRSREIIGRREMATLTAPMMLPEAEFSTRPQLAPLDTSSHASPSEPEQQGLAEDFVAQFKLGMSALHNGEHQEAIRHYSKAIELNPRAHAAYVNRAAAYVDTDDLNLALRDLETALALRPGAEAYHYRGIVHFMRENYSQAVQDISKALELQPANANAYIYRALAFSRQGSLDYAIRDFNEALGIMPTDASAYVGLGNVYNLMGDNNSAIENYNQALRFAPRAAVIYLNRGNAWFAKGDIYKAERDYGKALALDPELSEAYVSRSQILIGKGDLGGALRDLDKAIELNPNAAYSLYVRGFAYLQNGDLDRAIQNLDQAIDRGLNSSDLFTCRGLTYEMKGELGRAMQYYDQALSIRPNVAAFGHRAVALLRQSEWDKAKSDMLKASNMGLDLTSLIPGGLEAVAEFENANNIKLPQDIAEMLTVPEDLSGANAGEAVLEIFRKIHESLPEDAFDGMPTDGARNYKHYLYGWAKR